MTEREFQEWRTFKPDAEDKPYGWVQWKGTNVCLDFHCECGALGHVDDEFVYAVKCGACGAVYELSGFIEAKRIDPSSWDGCEPKVARVEDDKAGQ